MVMLAVWATLLLWQCLIADVLQRQSSFSMLRDGAWQPPHPRPGGRRPRGVSLRAD